MAFMMSTTTGGIPGDAGYGKIQFANNPAGRLELDSEIGYSHDALGHVVETTYPSGRKVARTFTPRGNLDVLTWNGTQIDDRNYDPVG